MVNLDAYLVIKTRSLAVAVLYMSHCTPPGEINLEARAYRIHRIFYLNDA
jgi:hypothetical protein